MGARWSSDRHAEPRGHSRLIGSRPVEFGGEKLSGFRSSIAERLSVVVSKRAGIVLRVWGESGIGKTFTRRVRADRNPNRIPKLSAATFRDVFARTDQNQFNCPAPDTLTSNSRALSTQPALRPLNSRRIPRLKSRCNRCQPKHQKLNGPAHTPCPWHSSTVVPRRALQNEGFVFHQPRA
jgi:hypothetical protein